jgi:hypothetical protein
MTNGKISIVTQIDMHIGTCQTGRTVGTINTVMKNLEGTKRCAHCVPFIMWYGGQCIFIYIVAVVKHGYFKCLVIIVFKDAYFKWLGKVIV